MAASGLDDEQLAAIERHEAEVARRQAPPSRALERAVGLSAVALSALGVFGAQHITVRNQVGSAFGPRWWPTAVALISLAMSLALSIIAFTRPPFEREGVETAQRSGWYRLVATLVLETAFIVAWYLTGNFVVPAILMLAAMLIVYGTRSWVKLITFPVLTVGLIYALFDLLLKIPL